MDFTIRQADSMDLKPLSSLFDNYRVFYNQSSDLERAKSFIAERVKNEESVIFVCQMDDRKLAGFVQLFPSFTSVGTAPVWILNDLYVDRDHRRKGIAEALIKKTIAFAKTTGRKKVILETGFDNLQAQGLYHKIGFTKESNFIFSYEVAD